MKVKELKLQPKAELNRILREVREKLRTLKFDLAQGKVKNTHVLRETRRDIARILTLLRDKS